MTHVGCGGKVAAATDGRGYSFEGEEAELYGSFVSAYFCEKCGKEITGDSQIELEIQLMSVLCASCGRHRDDCRMVVMLNVDKNRASEWMVCAACSASPTMMLAMADRIEAEYDKALSRHLMN